MARSGHCTYTTVYILNMVHLADGSDTPNLVHGKLCFGPTGTQDICTQSYTDNQCSECQGVLSWKHKLLISPIMHFVIFVIPLPQSS